MLRAFGLALALLASPQIAGAAPSAAVEAPANPAVTVPPPAPAAAAAAGEVAAAEEPAPAAGFYERMKPTEGKGMPVQGAFLTQDQYSPLGERAAWLHNVVLLPIIVVIALFVLFLLLYVVARYNRRANQTASRTSHNTALEIVWTLVPVLILVGIAVPSIDLLAKQFKPAPEGALTIKATGYQWYWTYSYPDNGEFEVVSNMLNVPNRPAINTGIREAGSDPSDGPAQLEVDNRMVVPAGEPIRLQVTAADVIHSFAVPSLWYKLDAVPGRINEMVFEIKEPGVYYGQCSELCGAKHAYMPIAVEALPREKFNAWVMTQAGGVIDKPAPAAQ